MTQISEKRFKVQSVPNAPGDESLVRIQETTFHNCHQEGDVSETIIAALRAYFLTHALDPVTGEIYTIH